MRSTLTLCLALAAAGAAHAQRVSKVDGAKLLSLCTGRAVTGCDAYLSGISDAIETMGRDRAPACIPGSVSATQMRDVTVKFLRDHPEDLNKPAGRIAVRALSAAFPCRG